MSLEELEKEFKRQKQKINIFISLKENEKIMENKRKETLYVEPPGYFQIVKRWWYGEDRTTTFNYLDKYVEIMINNKIEIFQIRIKSSFSNFYIDTIKKIRDICKYNKCKLI